MLFACKNKPCRRVRVKRFLKKVCVENSNQSYYSLKLCCVISPLALFAKQIGYDGSADVVPDAEYGTWDGGQGVGGKVQGGQ